MLGVIGEGLDEVPPAERRPVAELILVTLEGAMILVRACAEKDVLLRAGASLADVLEARFAPTHRLVFANAYLIAGAERTARARAVFARHA